MTGFLRSNRGIESDVDDTFTVVMQYSGERKNLIVTVKTAIVTPMRDQLKFFVRGTGGSYVKVRIALGLSFPVLRGILPFTVASYGFADTRKKFRGLVRVVSSGSKSYRRTGAASHGPGLWR